MITIFSRAVNFRCGLKRYMVGIKFIRKKNNAGITFYTCVFNNNAPSETRKGIMTFVRGVMGDVG